MKFKFCKFYILNYIILVGILNASANNIVVDFNSDTVKKIDWHTCMKKSRDENYSHPKKCDMFISCPKDNTQAYEVSCPPCPDQIGSDKCLNGKLWYNRLTDFCEWPSHKKCNKDDAEHDDESESGSDEVSGKTSGIKFTTPKPSTPESGEVHTKKNSLPTYPPTKSVPTTITTKHTTHMPKSTRKATNKPTTETIRTTILTTTTEKSHSSHTTTKSAIITTTELSREFTTPETIMTSEPAPETIMTSESAPETIMTSESAPKTIMTSESTAKATTDSPQEESCDPAICLMTGYCTSYKICNETTRIIQKLECPERLYWNPSWNALTIGGSCDRWINLDARQKKIYEDDPECLSPSEIGCEFQKKEECSNSFNYRESKDPEGSWRELLCPSGLFWEDKMKTCNFCYKVLNEETNELCICE